jgi:hypothetical protein
MLLFYTLNATAFVMSAGRELSMCTGVFNFHGRAILKFRNQIDELHFYKENRVVFRKQYTRSFIYRSGICAFITNITTTETEFVSNECNTFEWQ